MFAERTWPTLGTMNRTIRKRTTDRKHQQLAGLAVFSHCRPDELERIAGLTTGVSAPAGRALCTQGTVGREAFFIEEGEAEVAIDGQVVARLGPGALVGEMALLDGGPRVATVTATTPMRLFALGRAELRAVVEQSPHAAWAILEGVGARLRQVETGDVLT